MRYLYLFAFLLASAAAFGQHSVQLSWTASTTTGVTYNVFRSPASTGPWSIINSSPVTTTSFQDVRVTAGRTYWYEVKAVDPSNTPSAPSNTADAQVPGPPAAPSNLNAIPQ